MRVHLYTNDICLNITFSYLLDVSTYLYLCTRVMYEYLRNVCKPLCKNYFRWRTQMKTLFLNTIAFRARHLSQIRDH